MWIHNLTCSDRHFDLSSYDKLSTTYPVRHTLYLGGQGKCNLGPSQTFVCLTKDTSWCQILYGKLSTLWWVTKKRHRFSSNPQVHTAQLLPRDFLA